MGSVKDLEVLQMPTEDSPGRGRFSFSDRYSVFDYGGMPDDIPHKGKALCVMTAYFFEQLQRQGIDTHYRGLVAGGEAKKLEELSDPSNVMEVDLVRVIEPTYRDGTYDYSVFQRGLSNVLIPLEIIYRNYLPEGSSFRRRVKSGQISLQDYGLNSMPSSGEQLQQPIFDVSTKLEETDRYISWAEAQDIAGLSDGQMRQVRETLTLINQLITQRAREAGIRNSDGKIELALGPESQLLVVDALGTPDECRFQLNGFHVGKEILRQHYRGTKWHQKVEEAKKQAGPGWREDLPEPPALPDELRQGVADLYMACANAITGRRWFDEVGPLDEVIERLT